MITRCGSTLSGRGWSEIDFILQQFNLPTSQYWSGPEANSEFDYVRAMLGQEGAGDENIIALHDYLHGAVSHDLEEEPWSRSSCRVFISHLWKHRDAAVALQQSLDAWGVDSFVAHRDIEPGAEWVNVITAALHSCDAMVALLHHGFPESDWCDQEVGVAMGRSVAVVPVSIDMKPYGLLGALQALNWPSAATDPSAELARRLMDRLLVDKRTRDRSIEALVQRLESARSFEEANRTAGRLVDVEASLSSDQVERLRKAREENSQVGGAWHAQSALDKLLPEPVAPPAFGPDEAPF